MDTRYVSLFSGIGGLDRGLDQAGLECIAQVECDSWRRSVLERHWPKIPKHSLIEHVSPDDLPEAPILVGGFPCQDISKSNRHALGLNGDRSGMWFHFARLIRDLRPKVVLVENVPALRSRGLGDVLSPLASFGYDAIWDCLPAEAFGANHQRDRIFVVAWDASNANQKPIRFKPKRVQWQGWKVRTAVSEHWQPLECGEIDGWTAQPPLHRVDHGLPAELFTALDENDRDAEKLNRKREQAIGDAVVPQVAQYLGEAILESL